MIIKRQMDKQNVVYIYNRIFYLVIKRNEILLIHVTTGMNLENITLRERSPSQRPHII